LLQRAAQAGVGDERDAQLAVARGRTRRRAGGARRRVVPADCRPDRRAPPRAQIDCRPHGGTAGQNGRGRLSVPAGAAGARQYPNVAVKATGQAGYAKDAHPFRSFQWHLPRCFGAFGPERMFWGTDITGMPCSWRQCVTVFTEELPWLKSHDLELVMGEAVCNWVGWSRPA